LWTWFTPKPVKVWVAADQVFFVDMRNAMKERTILQDELDKVQDQIKALNKALNVRPDAGFGRGDPAVVRREVDRALRERLCERAETLKQALSETNQATRGMCEQCGSSIHPDRLAVLPDTTVCIQCALAAQNAKSRR
jgi:RNA polymerase-binding transcription factor DksA